MAKIRVKGDTSGYIDIAAPDVAGAATVNLDKIPQTDQVATFNNTLNVTQSGQTGIAFLKNTNASWAGDFNVSYDPGNTGTAVSNVGLSARSNGDVWVTSSSATGSMRIITGGANDKMVIDASGRVTMPYQIGFKASGLVSSPTPPATLVYDNVSSFGGFNQGSHYNTTNGRFTAPVAGVYLFSANAMGNNTSGRLMIRLMLNNADAHQGSSSSNSGEYQDSSFTVLVKMNVNDYVHVKLEGPKGLHGTNELEYYFSGYLLG